MDLNDWFISLDGQYEDGALIQKRYSLAQLTGGIDASAREADEASVKKDGKEVVAALHGVVMGRRSGPPSLDPKSGSFACSVTSRHHAQLNITSNAHVYITDLNSLHHTHIVPPASLSTYLVKDANDQSKSHDYPSEIRLSPWTPVQLCHLDTIVLGKMVVNERSQHKPIKLKVTFRYPELGEARPGGRKRLSRKTREQAETTFAHETGLLAVKNAIMALTAKSQSQSQMREDWVGQSTHQFEVSTASTERTRVVHPAGEATQTQSLKFKLETIVKSETTQSQKVIEADKSHDSAKPTTSASQSIPRYSGPSRGVDFEWLANLRSDKVIVASSSDDSIGSENVPVAADLSDSPRHSRSYGVPLSVLYSSEDDDDLPRRTQPADQSTKPRVANDNADEDDGMLEIEKVSSRHIVTIVPSSDDLHSDDEVHIVRSTSSPFSTYPPGPRPVPVANRPVPAVETSRANDPARPKSRSRTMEDDASNRSSPVFRAQPLNTAASNAIQAYKDRISERADQIRLAQADSMNHINTTADGAGDDEALPGMGTWYSFSDNEDDDFHPRSPRLAAATRVVSIVEPAPTRHHNPLNVLDKLMDMVEEADDVMSQGEGVASSAMEDEDDQPAAEMDDGLNYHIEDTGNNDKLDLVECSSVQGSDFSARQEPPEEHMADSDASSSEGYDSARDYEERSDYGDERSSMSGEGDSHYGDYEEDASISGSDDADAQDEDDQDRKDDDEHMDDEIEDDDENEEEDGDKGEVDEDEEEEEGEEEESAHFHINEINEIGVEDLGTAGDAPVGPTSVVLVEEVHELVVEEDGAAEGAESIRESAGEDAEEDMPEEHAAQASEDEHEHAHGDTSSRVRELFTPVEQIIVGTHLDHPLIQSLSSAGIRVPVSQLGELLEVEAEGQEMALEDIRHHKEEADLAKAIEESTKDVQEPAAQTPKPQPQPASQPVPRRSPQPAPQPVSQRVLQPASQPASRPAPSTAPRRRPASPSPLAELFRNPLIVNTEGEGPRLPTPRSLSGLLRDRRPDQGVQVDSALPPTLDAIIQTDHPMPELTRARTPSISDSSTVGPITPPSTLKRTLSSTTEGEGESNKAADAPVQGETRPTKRLRSIGRTVGLIAVGAVVGSVGTIAGLMQLGS